MLSTCRPLGRRAFVVAYFRLGLPAEAGHGLHRMLGLSRKQLKAMSLAESDAIVAEVTAAAAAAAAGGGLEPASPGARSAVGGAVGINSPLAPNGRRRDGRGLRVCGRHRASGRVRLE